MEQEKDAGVTIHNSMKPTMQCAKAASKATYRDKMTFLRLYSMYVKPHLEYAEASWNPWTHVDRDCLEKVNAGQWGIPTGDGGD